MPYPAIANSTSGITTSNDTTSTIVYPTGCVAGDLLVLLFALDGSTAPSTPGSWTVLAQSVDTGNDAYTSIYYRQLTGSVSGNFSITHASEISSSIILRIPWGDVPQVSTVARGSSTSPLSSALTHSWASGTEVLWLTCFGMDGNKTVSSFPWANDNIKAEGTASGGTTCALCSVSQTTNPTTPTSFGISSTETWVAYTVAIREVEHGITLAPSTATATTGTIEAFSDYLQLQRKTGVGGTYSDVSIMPLSATDFTEHGLVSGNTYYYRIRKCENNNIGLWSNEAYHEFIWNPVIYTYAHPISYKDTAFKHNRSLYANTAIGNLSFTGHTLSSISTITDDTNIEYKESAIIDATHTLFLFAYYGNTNTELRAAILTTSGSTTTMGTSYLLDDGGEADDVYAYPAQVCRLDSNTFVATFISSVDYSLISKVVTISNGVISAGSRYAVATVTSSCEVRIIILSSTKFVIVYKENSFNTYGHARVGEVSGTTISFGAQIAFTGPVYTLYKINATTINSSSFLIFWEECLTSGSTTEYKIIKGAVSGSTISLYNPLIIYDNNSTFEGMCLAVLNSTQSIITYYSYDTELLTSIIITDTNGVLTANTAYLTSTCPSYVEYMYMYAVNENNAIIAYTDPDVNQCKYYIARINGTAITYSSMQTLSVTNSDSFHIQALTSNIFLFVYDDYNGSAWEVYARQATIPADSSVGWQRVRKLSYYNSSAWKRVRL